MEQHPQRGKGHTHKIITSCGHNNITIFISAKLRQNAMTHRLKEYNRRKVWTVDTNDVEWITVELKDNGYRAKPTQRKQRDHNVHNDNANILNNILDDI